LKQFDRFQKLTPEHQKRILDACIEEFAEHGYERASTNEIVKKAGIPKGTLFYFFGSKKDLYLYILDMAVLRSVERMRDFYTDPPADLFDRLLYHSQARMQFVLSEPRLYRFFYQAFLSTPAELKSEMQNRYPAYFAGSQQLLLKDIDLLKFKEGVDVNQAYQLIHLVAEGVFNRYLPELSRVDAADSLRLVDRIITEVKGYFELLKVGLYR